MQLELQKGDNGAYFGHPQLYGAKTFPISPSQKGFQTLLNDLTSSSSDAY